MELIKNPLLRKFKDPNRHLAEELLILIDQIDWFRSHDVQGLNFHRHRKKLEVAQVFALSSDRKKALFNFIERYMRETFEQVDLLTAAKRTRENERRRTAK